MFVNNIYKFIFLLVAINALNSNAYASSVDNCPYEGTKIARGELVDLTRPEGTTSYLCQAPVESFEIVINQLAMCTADPTQYLNGSDEVDPCVYLMNTRNGDDPLTIGMTSVAETSFPATFPPTGIYTHGYALIDKTIAITAEYEVNNTIRAGNEAGNGTIEGTFFGPGNRTVTMKNLEDGLWTLSTEAFSSSQSTKNTMNFVYNSLSITQFLNTLSTTSALGNAHMNYLLKTDGKLASTYSEVDGLLLIETYGDPKVVTDQTTEILYKFSPDLAGKIVWEKMNFGAGDVWIASGFLLGNIRFTMDFN